MTFIRYRRYSFKEPAPITNDQFLYLKRQIASSAGFEIDGDFKTTFTSQYKKNIRWFLIGILACIGSIIMYKAFFDFVPGHFAWPEYIVAIFIVAGGAIALFMLMQMLLEGPSMATFLTERKLYFVRMKHAIRHYPDYPAFYASFYGNNNVSGSNASFRKEALREQEQAPLSLDRFLTRIFYLIDRHLWKVVLAVAAIILIRKYFLK